MSKSEKFRGFVKRKYRGKNYNLYFIKIKTINNNEKIKELYFYLVF